MAANKIRRPAPDSVPVDTAASRRARTALREAGPAPEPKMITVAQVCAELHISRSTFYDWRAKRKAPDCIVLPNGSLRVRRADLTRWLGSRTDAA